MCRLIKYSKEEYARIGIIPRYGDSDSIRWFEVQPNYTFHILNCFEDDNEVNYIISFLIFCFNLYYLSLRSIIYNWLIVLKFCLYEDEQVVVWGCRALDSIIPGPDKGLNKFEWLSKWFKPINSIEGYFNSSPEDGLLFSRCYEWRLDMQTGEVREREIWLGLNSLWIFLWSMKILQVLRISMGIPKLLILSQALPQVTIKNLQWYLINSY